MKTVMKNRHFRVSTPKHPPPQLLSHSLLLCSLFHLHSVIHHRSLLQQVHCHLQTRIMSMIASGHNQQQSTQEKNHSNVLCEHCCTSFVPFKTFATVSNQNSERATQHDEMKSVPPAKITASQGGCTASLLLDIHACVCTTCLCITQRCVMCNMPLEQSILDCTSPPIQHPQQECQPSSPSS